MGQRCLCMGAMGEGDEGRGPYARAVGFLNTSADANGLGGRSCRSSPSGCVRHVAPRPTCNAQALAPAPTFKERASASAVPARSSFATTTSLTASASLHTVAGELWVHSAAHVLLNCTHDINLIS